jgi:hypothetical protein
MYGPESVSARDDHGVLSAVERGSGVLVLGYRLALSKNRGLIGIRGVKSWFFAV